MKVDGVSFNENWVRKFTSAEEFSKHPSNAHLYPELKTEEAVQKKLVEVYHIFNPVKTIQHDTLRVGRKSSQTRSRQNDSKSVVGNAADDGRIEPQADGEGGESNGGSDNLPRPE